MTLLWTDSKLWYAVSCWTERSPVAVSRVEVGVALARRAAGGVHVAHDGVSLEEENNYVRYDETHQKVTEKNSKFHE